VGEVKAAGLPGQEGTEGGVEDPPRLLAKLFQHQGGLPGARRAQEEEGKRGAEDRILGLVKGEGLVQEAEAGRLEVQVAHGFGLGKGGLRGQDLLLPHLRPPEEAGAVVGVVGDDLEDQPRPLLPHPHRLEEEAVLVAELSAEVGGGRQLLELGLGQVPRAQGLQHPLQAVPEVGGDLEVLVEQDPHELTVPCAPAGRKGSQPRLGPGVRGYQRPAPHPSGSWVGWTKTFRRRPPCPLGSGAFSL
jgi:hypothetical protein